MIQEGHVAAPGFREAAVCVFSYSSIFLEGNVPDPGFIFLKSLRNLGDAALFPVLLFRLRGFSRRCSGIHNQQFPSFIALGNNRFHHLHKKCFRRMIRGNNHGNEGTASRRILHLPAQHVFFCTVLFKPDIIRNLLRFHAVHEVVEKFPGAEMFPVQYAFFDLIRCNRYAHLKSTPLKGAVIMIGTAVMIQIPETARTISPKSSETRQHFSAESTLCALPRS